MELAKRIYSSFDLPLSQESLAALQAHVDANPKGKHGKHEYDLATYGLTEDMINERFEFYTAEGRWPLSD
jgi:hypothetical protein